VLSILLAKLWGMQGVAVAWTGRVALDAFLLYTASNRIGPRRIKAESAKIRWSDTAPYFFALLLGIAGMLLFQSIVLRVISAFFVLLIYSAVCWRYFLDTTDKKTVGRLFGKEYP
jgi:hypothetical protein